MKKSSDIASANAIDEKILRSAYRWNTAGGILFALQSTFMLIVLTRVCDIYVAGVFTIAFANANLFMQIGHFGMRKFQASDRKGQYSFREYFASRVFSCFTMTATAAAYVAYSAVTIGYTHEKALIMFIMCVFKAIDSLEDVYTGAYQLQNRLDVGARMVTIRLALVSLGFIVASIVSMDLLFSITVTTALSALILAVQVQYVRRKYKLPSMGRPMSLKSVSHLIFDCLPLFIASFLLFYIGNAPKYAIDLLLDDASQAIYGYLSMPVFVVTLLASFIYNPMITSLTDQWNKGDIRALVFSFTKLFGAIVAITLACVGGAWLVGIPILGVLYNTNLADYLNELLILVIGGGFLAITTLATLGITIIRFQRVLIPLHVAFTAVAFFGSNFAVASFGLSGAAWAYTLIMLASALIFCITFALGLRICKP